MGEIRTEPVRIVARRATISAYGILGSATIPADKKGQVTFRQVYAKGSAEFMICDKTGTVGLAYLEAAGAEILQGDITKPIETLEAGSVRVRVRGSCGFPVACEIRIDLV